MNNIQYHEDAIYEISIRDVTTGECTFEERTNASILLTNDMEDDGVNVIKLFNCNGLTVANIISAIIKLQNILEKSYPDEYRAAQLKRLLDNI